MKSESIIRYSLNLVMILLLSVSVRALDMQESEIYNLQFTDANGNFISSVWGFLTEHMMIIMAIFFIVRCLYLENKIKPKSVSSLRVIKMIIMIFVAIASIDFLVRVFNQEWNIFREAPIAVAVFFIGRYAYLENKISKTFKISKVILGAMISMITIMAITWVIMSSL